MKTYTKPYRLVLALILLTMMLGIPKGESQTTSNPKYFISYTQTTSTNYEVNVADRNSVMEFEKAGMKPTQEVRNVSMVVNQNNELTTTINIVSSDASEPWMTPPSKIVIDKNGITLFNAQNGVLTQSLYTPEQNQDYLNTKADIAQNGLKGLPTFQALSASDITNLQQQGFAVQTLPGGVIQARKGDTGMMYNNAGMSYELTEYEGPKVLSQTTFKYRTEAGRTVPESRTERANQVTPSGVCVAFVTNTVFSNYQPIGLP